jgi:hypothetical protein
MENGVLMSSHVFHRLRATLIACSLSWVCGSAWCGQTSSITSNKERQSRSSAVLGVPEPTPN